MRRFTNIDNQFVLDHGLTLPESHVLEWMLNLPIWADRIVVNKKQYYFASKNKACEDLPVVTEKPDTMYRYYKRLEKLELINNFKINKKDYIEILPKCSSWNNVNKPDENPNEVGQTSEKNSENNPTNSNINTNSNLKDSMSLFSENEIENIPKMVIKILNDLKPTQKPFEFTPSNLQLVESRVKEGFKIHDFKAVIVCKIAEWKDNEKMKKYIRPSTLFGTKFNQYVVEAGEGSFQSNDGSKNFEFNPTKKAQLA